MANNYVLGRGKLYYKKTGEAGWTYFGNTPEFNLTIESEELEHFSSEEGVKEKDLSVPLQTNRSGSLITDNISADNVALFFFGEVSTITHSAGSVVGEQIDDVVAGKSYQLGETDQNPVGTRGIASAGFAVYDAANSSTEFVLNADYTVNLDTGLLTILETGDIADGTDLLVDYTKRAGSSTQVVSGSTPVEAAIKFVSANANGENADFLMPKVRLSPNGDYALKGDELQQIPLNLEILKPENQEAIYRNGRPAYT